VAGYSSEVQAIVHACQLQPLSWLHAGFTTLASSPGRFFTNIMGEKYGLDGMHMRTILVQIALTYTKGIRLVTYSAYYTVIPGYDSVLWKLALAMASSSFNFDRALAYALSCVKQEVLSLKDQQMEAVNCKVLSEGKNVLCGSLPAMESPYATSYCHSYLTSSWVGPTLPSLTEVSFLLFLPLCLTRILLSVSFICIFILQLFYGMFYGMFYC